MILSSNDFQNNELMDKKFSFRGGNISPHLKWDNFSEKIKSFALSCNDPDAPIGDWIHWHVINIPKTIIEIPRGGPIPGEELVNDYGKKGYGGPAPPSGIHRYFFRIYALDIDTLKGVNKNNFQAIIEKHVIDSAELIGLYKS